MKVRYIGSVAERILPPERGLRPLLLLAMSQRLQHLAATTEVETVFDNLLPDPFVAVSGDMGPVGYKLIYPSDGGRRWA